MADATSKYDDFIKSRSADDKPGTTYTVNGVTVTGEEMDAIKQAQVANRSQSEIEMDDMANQMRKKATERAAQKKSTLGKASGGKINLADCKVNTAKKNSSSPKW